MAKFTKISVKGSTVALNPDLEVVIEERYTSGKSDTVSIVCLIDAVVKVTGTVTGDEYVFSGGTPVDVDSLDADELLNKKRGKACCGGISGASVFLLA